MMQGLKHNFTEEENELIRTTYGKIYKAAALARRLNVSTSAIYKQARRLHVTHTIWWWTPQEDERLRKLLATHNPKDTARIMKRTVESIESRMYYLGITKHNGHDWYNATQVAQGLGVTRKWIVKQIESGKLKATLFHPEKPTEHGWWRILPADLKEWVQRYPGELQGRNIDIVWFVDLLVGIKYEHQL